MKARSLLTLTRLVLLFIAASFVLVIYFRNGSTSQMAQSESEREIINKIPQHVPIKVKIRAEKEKAIKDLKNEKWIRDFEIEVTNTSDKPIYFLNLWVVLPEIISYENGYTVGFSLRYGRGDFIHFKTIARADDLPIRPGETFTLSIPQKYQKGWERHKTDENRPNPKKIEISFTQLSFGDGSGFNGTDAKPYPYERSESRAGPCREGPGNSDSLLAFALESPVADFTKTFSFSFTPVAPLPVNLFHRRLILFRSS